LSLLYLFKLSFIVIPNTINHLQQLKIGYPVDEDQAILKAQKDPEAFRDIYERYYKAIFRFVLHRVGDKEHTADLTSQVFLKALQNLYQFKFKGFPFSSWLYRIAVNECNSYFRKNKRYRVVVLEETHAEMLYEEMFGNEVLAELKAELPLIMERLSLEDIQYIELRFMDERPFKEVAEIIGVSENYAKVRTYRVLDKMKKMFVTNERQA
jgi:RNA polymerase sigma-70 factor, ECF subfamily